MRVLLAIITLTFVCCLVHSYSPALCAQLCADMRPHARLSVALPCSPCESVTLKNFMFLPCGDEALGWGALP